MRTIFHAQRGDPFVRNVSRATLPHKRNFLDFLDLLRIPNVAADNNQHARDENLRMGHFITGTEAILALLSTPYP